METIGKRLRTARETRELSIEDVAHETRIQTIYIRGLENDDYSNFASTTYAKSFLTLYSRFLEVDAGEALLQFAGGDAISLSGQGYLEAVTDQIQPQGSPARRPYFSSRSSSEKSRPSESSSPGLAPVFLGIVLLLLVAAIPIMWYVGKDAGSIEEAGTNLEELAKNAKLTGAETAGQKPKAGSMAPEDPAGEKVITPESGPEPSRIKPLTTLLPPSFPKSEPAPPGNAPSGTPIAIPVQARPLGELPEKPETDPSTPATTPKTPEGVEPIRARPLLARPVVIPEETEPESAEPSEDGENSDESKPEEPVAKPRGDGNLFPRPQ